MAEHPLVQDAELLLNLMKGLPKRVVAAVPVAARPTFIATMDALTERAGNVQTEEDLLALADEIHRLVEGTPELRAFLLPNGRNVAPTHVPRRVTATDHKETNGKNAHMQARVAQIRGSVIDLRRTLENAIRQESAAKEKS